jgi:hypothetical protein
VSKIVTQVYVYRCDDDRCEAAICRDWEQLPPGWQAITVGRVTPDGNLDGRHYCPDHHREAA